MRELPEKGIGDIIRLASGSDNKHPICEQPTESVKAEPMQIIDDAIERAMNDQATQEPFSRDDYLDYVLEGRKRFSQGMHPLPKQ